MKNPSSSRKFTVFEVGCVSSDRMRNKGLVFINNRYKYKGDANGKEYNKLRGEGRNGDIYMQGRAGRGPSWQQYAF